MTKTITDEALKASGVDKETIDQVDGGIDTGSKIATDVGGTTLDLAGMVAKLLRDNADALDSNSNHNHDSKGQPLLGADGYNLKALLGADGSDNWEPLYGADGHNLASNDIAVTKYLAKNDLAITKML